MTLNTLAPTQLTNVLISDGASPASLSQANNRAVSALLEMQSTDGAFLISRMTTIQKNLLNPGIALMVFDTDLNQLQLYKNGAWGNVSAVLNFEDAAYAASTANLTATYDNGISGVGATLSNAGGLQVFNIDGIVPPLLSRILVKNQSSSLQNGIYDLTEVGSISVPWILTRAENYDSAEEINPGDFVMVNNGTVNANTAWVQTATVAVVGVDSISFSQFSPAGIPFIEIVGQNELFVGTNAGNSHGTSLRNTGMGTGNVLHSLSGGDDNTAYGYQAARDVTVGVNGCFFGSGAGRSNVSANSCVAVGYQALQNNTIQDNEIAIGDHALFGLNDILGLSNNNIAIGQHAAQALEDGQSNVFIGASVASIGTTSNTDNVIIGRSAFDIAENSDFNVMIGSEAGSSNAAYQNCIFLGGSSDATVSGLTNAIAIGTACTVGASNSMNLGVNCKVGINKSTPLYTLDVGAISNAASIRLSAAASAPTIGAADFGYIVYNRSFQTVNDTPVDINLIDIPNNGSCTIEVIVNGSDGDALDLTGGTGIAGYNRPAGSAVLVGTSYNKIASSTGDFSFVATSTFAALELVGLAATTTYWNVVVKILFNPFI